MSDNAAIIIKVGSNFTPYMRNVTKYSNFLNHALEKDPDPLFYLEMVENAILHVFKDLDALNKIHQPVPPHLANICFDPQLNAANFLLEGLKAPYNYPKEGVILDIEICSEGFDNALTQIANFYRSIHPSIEIAKKDRKLTIRMPNFDAFTCYTNLIFLNVQQRNGI